MSACVVLLGLTFSAIRFPLSLNDVSLECATRVSFQLPRDVCPREPRSLALRLLCAPNVAIEVMQGSAIIRVSGLSSTAARQIAQLTATELSELSDDAEWRAWVETGAAGQPFGRPRVIVDDIALLGVLASLDGDGDRVVEESRMRHRFVAFNDLPSVSCSLLARHFMHSARALFDESRLMIWFGDDGAEFDFDEFPSAVIDQFTQLFDNELNDCFTELDGQLPHHRRRLRGAQGFFIFSRSGAEAAAESFVRQALAMLAAVDAVNPIYALANGDTGTSVSLLGSEPTACQSDDHSAITFVDASGCEFRGKHYSLWPQLVSLLKRAPNVQLVSLLGCTLERDQLVEFAACTHSLSDLTNIMIGVKLYEEIQEELAALFERPSLLVPSSLSPAIQFQNEEVRQLMRTRIDRIRGLLMLQRRKQRK
jgi:hypothetical protein